jgi:uncharacterized protein HemY
VAKHRSSGRSEAELADRLGRALGVAFDARPIPVTGGSRGSLAKVGQDAWVALQIERRHSHPAENILQYWPWLERSRRRLVLVHAIAPDARKRTGARADLTKWLGAMMERVIPGRLHYCRIELGTHDEDAQIAAAVAAIDAVKEPPGGRLLITGA